MDKAQDNKQPPTAPPAVDRFNVPDIPPQDQGLKVLHDPKDVDAIDVDIVAVHGIMANPTSTWKHSKTGTNWLADPSMLPDSLKEHGVRIMAFGYESKWFGRGSVRQSLSNLATDLLQALNQKREHCPQRPIIFIAHCFGGLVAQKAYTMAALQEGDYPGIWKSTKGMMFLGTPHSGVNDGTNLTKQGQIYDAIVARKLEVQDNVLLTVARDNDVLVDAVSEFARKVSTSAPPPMLFSFYELKPTNLGAIVGQKFVPLLNESQEFVVGQSSATLLGHEKQGLALDHFGINKFEDNQDNNYQKVSWRILKMVREAKVDSLTTEDTPSQGSDNNRISVLPAILRKRDYFAPRDGILDRIEEKLSSKRGAVALCGESGSGKTHVAVEYADRYVRNNGVSNCHLFWVNASSAEEFEASYRRIGNKLRIPAAGVGHDAYLAAVSEHLMREEEWLMVLDGFNDGDALVSTSPGSGHEPRNLHTFLPKFSDSRRLLVTTVNRTVVNRLVKEKYVLGVGDLSEDDASRLLLGRVTKDPVRKKRINDIIGIVGDSAGALELVRLFGKLANKAVCSSEMLDTLRKQSKGGTGDEQTPKPAWDLLFGHLKSKNADTAYWLHVIGLLDVQMIPSIFFSANDKKGRLRELVDVGLVEAADGRGFYRIPAFFRQCLRSSLSEKHRQNAEGAALQSVKMRFVDDDRGALLPVTLAALRLEPSRAETRREQEALREDVAVYRRQRQSSLSPGIGYLATHDDHRRSSVPLVLGNRTMKAIEAAPPVQDIFGLPFPTKRALSEGHGAVQTRPLLLPTRRQTGPEWEKKLTELRRDSDTAVRLLTEEHPTKGSEDATAIYRRVIDGYSAEPHEYLKLAGLQYNLAIAQGSKGMVDDAAATFRQALQTILSGDSSSRTRNPEARRRYYRIYTDLASLYAAHGRLAEAQETFLHILPSQAAELGRDDAQTLRTRGAFARLLLDRGETELAGRELGRVLEASERVLGPGHRDTLATRCGVARHLAGCGRREEALAMGRSVLGEQERVLGRSHRETAATRQLLEELRSPSTK
ncbi:hypothetical protein ColKHC_08231 [Colletotrichum higginsianum]|nr:hypothetical protein ColKHC_08231 [Colletotrichum higginsianum]